MIPTHNRPAAVLRRAVDSVLHQSLDPGRVELIVVDDGSQPPAPPIDHPRVRWHRVDPARGVSRARNLGATLGSGDYFNFLDDDDVLLPDALERLLDAATTSGLPAPVAGIGGRCDVGPRRPDHPHRIGRRACRGGGATSLSRARRAGRFCASRRC